MRLCGAPGAVLPQNTVPPLVLGSLFSFLMVRSVQLHNEPLAVTVEVHDPTEDHLLLPELQSVEPLAPQAGPEEGLAGRPLVAQHPSEGFLLLGNPALERHKDQAPLDLGRLSGIFEGFGRAVIHWPASMACPGCPDGAGGVVGGAALPQPLLPEALGPVLEPLPRQEKTAYE